MLSKSRIRKQGERWTAARDRFVADRAPQLAAGVYLLRDWTPYAPNNVYCRFAERFARDNGFQQFVFVPPWGARPVRLYAHSAAQAFAYLQRGLSAAASKEA